MRCNDAICSLIYNNKQGMNYKQLLDSVFVISGIIKVEVSVISRSLRPRLLIIPDIIKISCNNLLLTQNQNQSHHVRVIFSAL